MEQLIAIGESASILWNTDNEEMCYKLLLSIGNDSLSFMAGYYMYIEWELDNSKPMNRWIDIFSKLDPTIFDSYLLEVEKKINKSENFVRNIVYNTRINLGKEKKNEIES